MYALLFLEASNVVGSCVQVDVERAIWSRARTENQTLLD
jgi:hypothetical protein